MRWRRDKERDRKRKKHIVAVNNCEKEDERERDRWLEKRYTLREAKKSKIDEIEREVARFIEW